MRSDFPQLFFSIAVFALCSCKAKAPPQSSATSNPTPVAEIPRAVMGYKLGQDPASLEKKATEEFKKCVRTNGGNIDRDKCGDVLSKTGDLIIVHPDSDNNLGKNPDHVSYVRVLSQNGKAWQITVAYGSSNFYESVKAAIVKYGGSKDKEGKYFVCRSQTCLKVALSSASEIDWEISAKIPVSAFQADYFDEAGLSGEEQKPAPL